MKAPLRQSIGSDKPMTYYLAGPMSDHPEYNFPLFDAVATRLRGQGYHILSPHEVNYGETPEQRGSLPYATYVKGGLQLLLACDGIILLPEWRRSRGAVLELDLATKTGMSAWYYNLSMSYPHELP